MEAWHDFGEDYQISHASPSSGYFQRHATLLRWLAVGCLVLALLIAVRTLPVDDWMEALREWIEGLGPWGPVIYALIYIVSALFFVPAAALTLAAGPLFGLFWGTLIVSIASTTAATLAFLIARYLARKRVERAVEKRARFSAVDRAITEGGWRVIALLRLSPAVPFSLGNYMFGVTGVRLVPYVFASWIAMLPGTFMYVYLGYVGGAAVGKSSRTRGEWAMLVVGLTATAAVTVYVTLLAKKKIDVQSKIADDADTSSEVS